MDQVHPRQNLFYTVSEPALPVVAQTTCCYHPRALQLLAQDLRKVAFVRSTWSMYNNQPGLCHDEQLFDVDLLGAVEVDDHGIAPPIHSL